MRFRSGSIRLPHCRNGGNDFAIPHHTKSTEPATSLFRHRSREAPQSGTFGEVLLQRHLLVMQVAEWDFCGARDAACRLHANGNSAPSFLVLDIHAVPKPFDGWKLWLSLGEGGGPKFQPPRAQGYQYEDGHHQGGPL